MKRDHLTLIKTEGREPEATLQSCYKNLLVLTNEVSEAFEGLDPELHDQIVNQYIDVHGALNNLRSRIVEVALQEGELGWL